MRFSAPTTWNGGMYENAVPLELMRREYEVCVSKLYQKEVDVVAKRSSELVCIQVSDDDPSAKTLKRKLSPLFPIRDAYPKILLVRAKHESYTVEGIHVVDSA